MPYFSIITPMFNRERFIARAIDSCLRQNFADFELIVVDDASVDGSVDVVRGYTDPRIKLICCEINRGVSPARNTGGDAAHGQWVICLDSDDELSPGALAVIRQRTLEVGDDIARLQFMCRMDDGRISPSPPLIDEVWDYEGYVRWTETVADGLQETLPVVRLSTFENVRYPDDRTLEGIYHLGFAQRYRMRACPDVVRLYHSDADNTFCFSPDVRRVMMLAPDAARSADAVIARHGEALQRWAPMVFANTLRGAATSHFLAGNRAAGIRYAVRCLRRNPRSLKVWAVLVFGLLGPRPLAVLKTRVSA